MNRFYGYFYVQFQVHLKRIVENQIPDKRQNVVDSKRPAVSPV